MVGNENVKSYGVSMQLYTMSCDCAIILNFLCSRLPTSEEKARDVESGFC